MQKHIIFVALVCWQFEQVRSAALRRWEIVDLIYHSYKRSDFKAFKEYPDDLFTPLAGPYYRKLSKLTEPEALHIAVNGFRSGSRGVVSQIFPDYPWIEMGKFVIYEVVHVVHVDEVTSSCNHFRIIQLTGSDSGLIVGVGEREFWGSASRCPCPYRDVVGIVGHRADDLLHKYVKDVATPAFLNDDDLSLDAPVRRTKVEKGEFTLEQIITYSELQRPRYFLAFFVDIYRIAFHLNSLCKKSADYVNRTKDCVQFFFSYSHLLVTYTQVICSYLGADPELDIDGICPNLCQVRDAPLWEAVAISNSSTEALTYLQLPNVHEAVDICAQIPFAVPGTCRLRGKGIFDHEFT
ncbi:unnamed protein product [Schistocephalus solidus]|uniref:Peptidase S1 domain-containing protein n=1 Tax=Schistocephalus solidus TaxID=70667 RepID=A0A183STR4_SCHSO|nr:unnamed protein product [Schistocephalus solidus]